MCFASVVGEGGAAVRKEHDNLRLVCRLQASLDAHPFDGIIRMPDAGRVDKAEGMAADDECGINGVACGALKVADDGSVIADDGIEESALPDIGGSDDGYGNAVSDGVAYSKTAGQIGDGSDEKMGLGGKFGTVSKLHIFMVREIKFQFEECSQLQ